MEKKDIKADGQKDNDQPLIHAAVTGGQEGAFGRGKDLFQDRQGIKSQKDTYCAKRKDILIQDGLDLLEERHQPQTQ
jgi:lipase chaperone LimK